MDDKKVSELIDMLKGSFEVGTKYAESDGRNNERFDYEHTIHNEACKEVADYIAEFERRIAKAKDLLNFEMGQWRSVPTGNLPDHYIQLRQVLDVLDGGGE